MTKLIAKVSGGKSSFRVVIPRKLIGKFRWEKVEYVVIEDHHPEYIKIRRLFDDENSKR